MGEERQDARTISPGRKLTVSEAADHLNISAEAVRSRIKRGTLRSVKDGSTVYVLIETDQTPPEHDRTDAQTTTEQRPDARDELVESLREQVAYLQGVIATRDRELSQRGEEIRRRDAALEREQQLTAMFADRLRAIEAPQEPRNEPESAGSRSDRVETPEEPERPAERPGETARSWWRRLWGG